MKRNIQLEKYIKRHTGHNVKVFTVKWLKGGYGAKMNTVTGLKICEEVSTYKPLIWHEMGHLIDEDMNWVKNEIKAQTWALKRLKKLGYNKIYEESLDWIKSWQNIKNASTQYYKEASEIILNEIR